MRCITDPVSRYFAYGSNLLSSRMVVRVPSARALFAARVQDHRLSLGKAGRDGSGKATLVAAPGAHCWGVVYAIDPREWPRLDGFEPGYTRVRLPVFSATGRQVIAETYLAPETAPRPAATAAYKRLLIEGAREHGLPADHLAVLAQLPVLGLS